MEAKREVLLRAKEGNAITCVEKIAVLAPSLLRVLLGGFHYFGTGSQRETPKLLDKSFACQMFATVQGYALR